MSRTIFNDVIMQSDPSATPAVTDFPVSFDLLWFCNQQGSFYHADIVHELTVHQVLQF